MQVLNELIASVENRKVEREMRFIVTANRIARGESVDAPEVEAALTAAGKSVDDLRTAAELARQRDEWRRQVAARPRLEEEREEIARKIEKENSRLQKAQHVHATAVAPLHARLAAIEHALSAAAVASGELLRTVPLPSMRGELDALNGRADALARRATDLRQQADFRRQAEATRARAAAMRAERVYGESTHDIQRLEMAADREQALAGRAEHELAVVEAGLAEIRGKIDALVERAREL